MAGRPLGKGEVRLDVLIAFGLFLAALLCSLALNVSALLPLVFGAGCFFAVGRRRGFESRALLKMMAAGVRKSMVVIRIFVLIGLITALWRSSGTVSYLVYWGIKLISPGWFLVCAFLITCLISYALGTSLGAAGTIGVVLIVLAKGGGVHPAAAGGMILAGAYFGDRCAPTSSSANLVAMLTETDLYGNIRGMFRTAALPFALSVAVCAVLSRLHPLEAVDPAFLSQIEETARLSPLTLIPAVLILALPLFRCGVRTAMAVSLAAAFLLSVLVQGMSAGEALTAAVFGYQPAGGGAFGQIIAGGGLMSMVKVMLIVSISCTISGLFDGTGMLSDLEGRIESLAVKTGRFPVMLLVSLVGCAAFCNQTLAVIMSCQLAAGAYQKQGASRRELAIDLENSAILLSALIPWNIACAAPLDTLDIGAESILYAVYLYLVPVCYLFTKRFFRFQDEGTDAPKSA